MSKESYPEWDEPGSDGDGDDGGLWDSNEPFFPSVGDCVRRIGASGALVGPVGVVMDQHFEHNLVGVDWEARPGCRSRGVTWEDRWLLGADRWSPSGGHRS